ncbi:MAG: TMEM175 family protein, partial [Chloroflexota bacterium]|nr:TMEM175 family protein [Chloroflexota bacterium]
MVDGSAQAESREVGVDRLLAFSDGVFAIAITLLVLDLHQPTVAHGLLGALLQEWPAYLSYALSFLIIGIIWAQHHAMFRSIRRTDHLFLLINVVFLMWIAVLPFPTALLAKYLDSPS